MERRATTNDCENCTEKNICEVQNMMNNYGFQCKMFSPVRPSTNADLIRAMSDEELAEWFDRHASEPLWCVLPECPDHEECVKCILKWLKSPVEAKNG